MGRMGKRKPKGKRWCAWGGVADGPQGRRKEDEGNKENMRKGRET